jgi:hypothetical protein
LFFGREGPDALRREQVVACGEIKPVFEVSWRALGSEDRCLLCRELLLRDDALVFSLRELPKLLEHVSAHGGCSRR